MSDSEYEMQRALLTQAQLQAVEWNDGALLVLAGPGSGKTRVLTSRIARIISESQGKSFKILALTFTNKAADEMQSRVHSMVSEGAERASISTFHSFCMQMLQQHGSHVGLSPDFTIYSLDEDRREILRDGLRNSSVSSGSNDASLVRYLQLIDKLKTMLVGVEGSASKFRDKNEGENVAAAYRAYEAELARLNALDFNSLILHAYSLVTKFEGIASRYRKTYRHWLIDEFQDTNRAQYKFLRALAGSEFKNVFAVADDDQIIYQWNGASFQQLQKFQADFEPAVLQLPTNWRCPAQIVAAANNLVRHNTIRSASKLPLEAGKATVDPKYSDSILIGSYDDEQQEAEATAALIASRPADTWGESAVIARNKATLEKIKQSLKDHDVPVVLAQRKDDFSSPQFCWMQAVLKQSLRKQDKRNFETLVASFNRWSSLRYSSEIIASLAEGSGRALYDEWAHALSTEPAGGMTEVAGWVSALGSESASYGQFIQNCLKYFDAEGADEGSDLGEDFRAWRSLQRAITSGYGKNIPLDQFLQHIALQSKEPPSPANTVTLMTVHASKGKEFDFVHVVGLAEEVMPSYYSVKAGDQSPEMEEERRNCFVAITRTKRQLVLTYAKRYRGYAKRPSRFLSEMGYPPR